MRKIIISDVGGVIAWDDVRLYDTLLQRIEPDLSFKKYTNSKKKPENYAYWEKYSTGKIGADEFYSVILKDLGIETTEENISFMSDAYRNASWGIANYELLEQLRKSNCELAVLSNSSLENEEHATERDLLQGFEYIFYSHRIGFRKPSKEAFIYVMTQLGTEPADCFFIDDKIANTKAAEELGMWTNTYDRNYSENFEELKFKLERFAR